MDEQLKAPASGFDVRVTDSEAEIVRRYDRQRRQRLLVLMGAAFGGAIVSLLLVITVVIIAAGRFGTAEAVQLVGVTLNALIYVAVIATARKGRIEWSAALFSFGAGVLPNFIIFALAATGAPSPFAVAYLMGAIVIVSLAGRPWMVFCTALLSSITTVYMIYFAPLPDAPTPAQLAVHVYLATLAGGVLPIMFIAYWGMAVLLLVQWRSFQRLLLELAEVRVQVERARQLDELKDQFIRTVNHELRTPIMALLGYLDLLMNPENRVSAERVERYVQRANRAGQSLRTLLTGILDTRRLYSVKEVLKPERLDILATLEEVIPLIPAESPQGVPIERALRLRLPPGVSVWAEPIAFQQVLINLLSNAVKYSEPGTPVDIEARVTTEEGTPHRRWGARPVAANPMVEIAVRDYGLGIPPEHHALLFQRFMRLPRELESNVMGTGLGLYLCKSMVEAMHGSIRVTSTGIPGEGTTLLVKLPLPPTAGGAVADAELPPVSLERFTSPRLPAISGAASENAAHPV